jgi:hypothetical protein
MWMEPKDQRTIAVFFNTMGLRGQFDECRRIIRDAISWCMVADPAAFQEVQDILMN